MSKKKIIAVVLILAIVAGGLVYKFNLSTMDASAETDGYTEATVTVMDLSDSLSGSGTLEAADSYTVTPLVLGEVISADFEVGDTVEEGDLLYEIDSSDLDSSIEQAEMSLEQTQLSYNRTLASLDDLYVTSDASGTVTELTVEVGDSVSAGATIGTVVDSDNMLVAVEFIESDVANISVGNSAQVTVTGSYETITGTVTSVSGASSVNSNNVPVREVTVTVANPGGLQEGMTAYVMVGAISATAAGEFEYKTSEYITSSVSGDVIAIYKNEGDWVSKGATVVVLENESLTESLEDSEYSIRNAEISLEKQYENLDNYLITSPITGTVVEKIYKEGDTISDLEALCTIFDLTYLTTTLSIDELDISTVEEGQSVSITVEALDNAVYEGIVTSININGTTSSGVTSYPVTVQIDEIDNLLPGMNADFEIIVEESLNAVVVPINAVVRGNRVLAYTGTTVVSDDENIPEGYEYVEVVTGISTDDYVEIISGLEEGDEILLLETVLSDDNASGMPGMMGGQQGGSGAPSGGGAPPSGGGGGF